MRFFGITRIEQYASDTRRVVESIFPSPRAIETEMIKAGICQRGWCKLFFRGHLKNIAEVKGIPFNDAALTSFADSFCMMQGGRYKMAVFLLFFSWLRAGMGSTYGNKDVTQIGSAFSGEYLKWYAQECQRYIIIDEREQSSDDGSGCSLEEAEAVLGYKLETVRALSK